MTPYDTFGYTPEDEEPDPEAQRRAALSDQFGDELMAGRNEQQQAAARRIYEQLKAGAEVDDVKHLIADLSRAASPGSGRGRPGTGTGTGMGFGRKAPGAR